MKKGLFIALFCVLLLPLFTCNVLAQDIIVKKDGSIIKAKVLEVTESSILYKNYGNINGPSYSISIANVMSLTYENGQIESFDNASSMKEEAESKEVSTSDMSDAILLSRIADLDAKASHIQTVGNWVGTLGILGILTADVLLFYDNLGLLLGIGVPVLVVYTISEIALFNSFSRSYTKQADSLRSQLKHSTVSLAPSLFYDNTNRTIAGGLSFALSF